MMSPAEVMSDGFHQRRRPSVFVAYRFHDRDSVGFRSRLATLMQRHPSLAGVTIADGRVPPGAYWAETVRRLIGHGRLVVGDVTGPSREVMFELGFGYGLRKPIVPVVRSSAQRADVPPWLTSIQVDSYESDIELTALLAAIDLNITRAGVHRPRRPPEGVPGLAVWLGRPRWTEAPWQQFQSSARASGLHVESFPLQAPDGRDVSDDVMERVGQASLLVAALDGTARDMFVHFMCGCAIARPAVGMAAPRLRRRILLLPHPRQRPQDLVADSAQKCREVGVVRTDGVLTETRKFASDYRRWAGLET